MTRLDYFNPIPTRGLPFTKPPSTTTNFAVVDALLSIFMLRVER
jgi:hypothetical protein